MPSVEKMKETGVLVSVAAAKKILSKTEPVDSVLIDEESSVKFSVADDWNEDIDTRSELSKVAIKATIDGTEYTLSKAAAFAFGSLYGVQSTYSQKIPGHLYEALLNHHYEQSGKARSAIIINGTIHALIRPKMSVYSNLDLLDAALGGIEDVFGKTPVLVDRRTFNTLTQTDVRLVIPEQEFVVPDSNMLDVEDGEDVWSYGIHVANSVSGKKPTSVNPYLFRYWGASGVTVADEALGSWHRAHDSIKDVYDWARDVTKQELSYGNELADKIKNLTSVDAEGRVGQIINDTLKPLHVGVALRQEIADSTLDYDEVSVYTLANLMAAQANRPGMTQDYIGRITTGAGELIAGRVTNDKKAVWKEGREAPEDATNPYEIG